MRRGFKSWCERVAAEYREALGVPMAAALDPRALAEHLNVRVLMPENVPGVAPVNLRQLRGVAGSGRLVGGNHLPGRRQTGDSELRSPKHAASKQSGSRTRSRHPQSHVGRSVVGWLLVPEQLRQGAGGRSGLARGVFASAAGGIAARVQEQTQSSGPGSTLRRQPETRQLAAAHDGRHTPIEVTRGGSRHREPMTATLSLCPRCSPSTTASPWVVQRASAGLCSPLTQRPRIGPPSTNAACRRDGAPTDARSMNRPSPPTSPSSTTPGHAATPRHTARGFPDGFGGVGLHHQDPVCWPAADGRPANGRTCPPFDHPKVTRHNGGSMDRLPDVMVDDHKLRRQTASKMPMAICATKLANVHAHQRGQPCSTCSFTASMTVANSSASNGCSSRSSVTHTRR